MSAASRAATLLVDVLESVPGVEYPEAAAAALVNAFDTQYHHYPSGHRTLRMALVVSEPEPSSKGRMQQ